MFLFITPGTPRIVIISYSMNYGVQKCVWTALGAVTANFIQGTLVIFVLGSFFLDNPNFLNFLKWVGVLYLFYLSYDVYKTKPKNMDNIYASDVFFGNTFPISGSMIESIEPKVSNIDEDRAFEFEAFVAGYDKDEINLEVKDNTLTLCGNKKEDDETKDDDYRRKEFSYSNFKRYFNLSEEIEREKISAEFTNGVLIVNLPKKEKAQPKKIPITVN